MSEERRKIWLVGIGMGSEESLTYEAKRILEQSDCIIGAERMIERFVGKGIPCVNEYRPDVIREYVKSNPGQKKIAVALSGDVGFYSAAKRLEELLMEKEFWEEELPVVIRIPGISSATYLAAALHMEWEDIYLVSMHGRRQNFINAVNRHEKTFLLMGGKGCGEEVVEKLSYYGLKDVVVHIGKNLSYPDEEMITKRAGELKTADLEGLCAAVIENPNPQKNVFRHLEDEAFERGKVPMTKSEVRTVCMAKLRLKEDAVLYDVGAGTGSIAIEAALQSDKIKVYAIEKNSEGVMLIRENSRKFRTDTVEIVQGYAPEALKMLEPPTHVFIGGSSGNLKEIITCVKEKNKNVRIVLTCISLDTLRKVMEAVEEGILREPEIVQISAAKSKLLGRHHMMTGENPIYIISEE